MKARSKKIAAMCGIFLLLQGFPGAAEAGNFRIRLREHFEWLSVRYEPLRQTVNYFGLTNTANIWYEEPFQYAYGLAFGPVLGSAKAQGSSPPTVDSKIRLWNIGVEGKYFFFPKMNSFFGRLGVTGNVLDTRGSDGAIKGGGYYLGLGWESKIGRIGLAPEVAFRHVLLEKGSRVFAFTPSVGVHFYVLPSDKNSKIK